MITIDTREKSNKIIQYFDAVGQKYIRSKLYTGDYALTNNQRVVIDRKRSLLELAGNLGQNHERFKREILRAAEIGARFVVLIEERITFDKIPNWTNKLSKVKGETLAKMMSTISQRYGVEWCFCAKPMAGQKIIEILKGEVV